jgi:hypothetical protein
MIRIRSTTLIIEQHKGHKGGTCRGKQVSSLPVSTLFSCLVAALFSPSSGPMAAQQSHCKKAHI